MAEPTKRTTTTMPTKSQRPVGRDEVVDACIRAAADLFAENNPSKVSVREIARRAGVSHALVHRYLGSKDDIFRAVLEWERSETLDALKGISDISEAPSAFDGDFEGDRYLRIVLRACIEGMPVDLDDDKFPSSRRVLDMLAEHPVRVPANARGFDPRILLLTVTAATASLVLAKDVFLSQADLRGMDEAEFHAEFDRLLLRILSLAAAPE